MSTKPLISILIPTYNVEEFVEEAILSIINQTYKNLEIIIVDDASTDNTFSILKKLEKKDLRIKLFRNNKNSKIAETLNFAFQQSTGQYIGRMDGDDISLPNKFELQYNYLLENSKIDLVGCNLIHIDEFGNEISRKKSLSGFDNLLEIVKYSNPIPHVWLTKREVYENVGPYRLPGTEDYDFLLRMLTKGYKFDNHPLFLYKVRSRYGNTSTNIGLLQYYNRKLAYRSYVQRVKEDKENISLEDIKISYISNKRFSISSELMRKAVIFKNENKNLLSYFYVFSSILLSPFIRTKIIYDRVKYNQVRKRIMELEKNENDHLTK